MGNKIQEIDQRSGDELIINCHCGDNHFIKFDYCKFDDCKMFYINMIAQSDSLWNRIKQSFKYILNGDDMFYTDIGLTESDLDKIVTLINKYKQNE